MVPSTETIYTSYLDTLDPQGLGLSLRVQAGKVKGRLVHLQGLAVDCPVPAASIPLLQGMCGCIQLLQHTTRGSPNSPNKVGTISKICLK